MPKVSIICRTYNHKTVIAETINSVLKQTFEDWELIIGDDFSQENTYQGASSFTDPRIKVSTPTEKWSTFFENHQLKIDPYVYSGIVPERILSFSR